MSIFLLLIFLILSIFHVATRYSRSGRLTNKIPGYAPFPLIGNLLRFNVTTADEFWNQVRKLTATLYPVSKVWFVRSAVICIVHSNDAEILLTSQKTTTKSYIYEFLRPWLRTGLLTSTGDKWRNRRKILTPAFHFNILKKYLDIFNEKGERCVSCLKNEGEETIKNLVPFRTTMTLNIICESAMGISLNNMDNKVTETYKSAIHDFGYVAVFRVPRPYVFDWMLKLPWKIGNMSKNAVKVLHGFSSKVITERRAYHLNTENRYLSVIDDPDEDNTNKGSTKRLAMLDLLLAAEQKRLIDDEGIAEEVDTFTFEGHDTTGTALIFTLLLLAENEKAQDRVREEINSLLDREESKLNMKNIQELSYLEQCIKESMRLYPPVPTLSRYTTENLQLKHALVPGGSHIVLHLYDLHRDPNFWREPNKFDPDRFLLGRNENRHPFAYIPFSAGSRNCIGQKFAMMEMKSTIAYILHDFYMEPVTRTSDIKLIADIVLRPHDSVFIKFVKINRK